MLTLTILENVTLGGPGDLVFKRNKMIMKEPPDLRSKTWYLKKDQATDLGPLPDGGDKRVKNGWSLDSKISR